MCHSLESDSSRVFRLEAQDLRFSIRHLSRDARIVEGVIGGGVGFYAKLHDDQKTRAPLAAPRQRVMVTSFSYARFAVSA